MFFIFLCKLHRSSWHHNTTHAAAAHFLLEINSAHHKDHQWTSCRYRQLSYSWAVWQTLSLDIRVLQFWITRAGKMVGDDQNPCIGIKDGSGKPATKTAALESPLYNPEIAYIFYYPDASILIFNDFSKKLSTRFKMKWMHVEHPLRIMEPIWFMPTLFKVQSAKQTLSFLESDV